VKILITGGAGFVGSNLAVALRSQSNPPDVVCLDNLYRRGSELNLTRLASVGARFVHGDVRDPKSFPDGPFDFLVECSAEPSVLAGQSGSPDYLVHTNLVGAYNCLEQARNWGAGFMFLSTSRVYPIARLEAHPWREEATRFAWEDSETSGISSAGVSERVDMSGARSLYGFTKLAAEQLIEEYRASYKLRAVVNRCGVIAGPWQFGKVDQGVLAHWVMAHLLKRPLSYIGYGGTGKQVRDFLHVDDLSELLIEQLSNFERWKGWVGNVAGGVQNSASLLELTKLCAEITGNTLPIAGISETRPSDLRLFVGDCDRLYKKTHWRPKRSVADIVSDTAAWVKDRQSALSRC
jgi:CDP-paratose 2-epimerase